MTAPNYVTYTMLLSSIGIIAAVLAGLRTLRVLAVLSRHVSCDRSGRCIRPPLLQTRLSRRRLLLLLRVALGRAFDDVQDFERLPGVHRE